MKVLVTGATGFLGGALVESLLAHGETDLVLTARTGANRARLEAAAARHPKARIEYLPVNLVSRDDAARAVRDVQVVYHLAASLRGAPADMFLNTVVATKNLLEAIGSRKPMRVVMISSFSVYGVAELGRGAVVDEQTPLETHPDKRDLYAHVKLRQEKLGWDLGRQARVRAGGAAAGRHLRPGRQRVLDPRRPQPVRAVPAAWAGATCCRCRTSTTAPTRSSSPGSPARRPGRSTTCTTTICPPAATTCARYRREVRPVRAVPIPYPVLKLLSAGVERYHRWSQGQLPAVFTPYKTATAWGGNRFDNGKIKAIGWRQAVPTPEAMQRTFDWLRADWLRAQATG